MLAGESLFSSRLLCVMISLCRALQASHAPSNVIGCKSRTDSPFPQAEQLRLCHEHLPDFAITYITVSLILAREYMKILNVAINMRQETLFGLGGRAFRERCQAEERPLYAWTVNKKSWMEWCIGARVDCVITDDPKLYLEVCGRRRRDEEEQTGSGKARRRVKAAVARPRDLVLGVFYTVMLKGLMRIFRAYERLGYPEQVREELRPLT